MALELRLAEAIQGEESHQGSWGMQWHHYGKAVVHELLLFLAPEGVLLWGAQGKERSGYLRGDSIRLSLLRERQENDGRPEFLFTGTISCTQVCQSQVGLGIRTQR